MNTNLIGQLALIIVAIILIVSFIQPTMATVSETQDAIFEVTDAIDKVEFFNNEMQARLNTIDSISLSDMDALDVYLPSTVDELAVMSDVVAIAESAGVTVTELSNEANASESSNQNEGTESQNGTTFSVALSGSYEALKNFLVLSEFNDYPLQITSIEIGATEAGEASDEESTGAPLAPGQTFSLTIHVPVFNPASVDQDALLPGDVDELQ